MTPQQEQEIYKAAIAKWGTASQLDMLIEECAELIQAVNKFKRNPWAETEENLCEEMADVEIMIAQVSMITDGYLAISKYKEEKLTRLSELLKSAA